jgi:hypothetical protein
MLDRLQVLSSQGLRNLQGKLSRLASVIGFQEQRCRSSRSGTNRFAAAPRLDHRLTTVRLSEVRSVPSSPGTAGRAAEFAPKPPGGSATGPPPTAVGCGWRHRLAQHSRGVRDESPAVGGTGLTGSTEELGDEAARAAKGLGRKPALTGCELGVTPPIPLMA